MVTQLYACGILQYIPFFYVIWSDDLLSYSEIAVVKNAIEKDKTLTTADYTYLIKCLDKTNPPANKEIKNWKKAISNSQIKLVENDIYAILILNSISKTGSKIQSQLFKFRIFTNQNNFH